ncbi:nuclear transport factor 2 family protein [Pseudovibrio sp. POLY-S9]|uniref:nuclear transport factor 2 family protein n=1 Tax=Pseudovibrio sp. POLY-S9 TaxID=1576596 RepID=UPI00137A9728|nr:nuclear transport factor 2 family protein [Pseudovibrio sp. POLY-S9]
MLETLLSLESQLLLPSVRGKQQQLELLLHPDFIEIGASGRMYDRARILTELPGEAADYPVRTIENFRLRKLNEELVQVFYSIVENETQRTSIWKLEGGQWSMIYHQGTRRAS